MKIGDAAPVEVASTTRRWLEVPYNVNRDTYIYIYLVDKSAAARANNDSGRSGTRIGKRETAHGIVFSLRCASAPVEVSDISVYVDYIMGRDTFIFHSHDHIYVHIYNYCNYVHCFNIAIILPQKDYYE